MMVCPLRDNLLWVRLFTFPRTGEFSLLQGFVIVPYILRIASVYNAEIIDFAVIAFSQPVSPPVGVCGVFF